MLDKLGMFLLVINNDKTDHMKPCSYIRSTLVNVGSDINATCHGDTLGE